MTLEEWQYERPPWPLSLKLVNKFINYITQQRIPCSIEVCLRDPCIESSKGGQPGANGEARKAENSHGHRCSPAAGSWLLAQPGREEEAGISMGQEEQSLGGSPAGQVARTAAEPAERLG